MSKKVQVDLNEKKLDLLELTSEEKKELTDIKEYYYFYKGAYSQDEIKLYNKKTLGQSWLNNENVKYTPSQVIDNKTQELINKQSRFFLGREPFLLFKLIDTETENNKDIRDSLERYRVFIDGIFEDNRFWTNMMKAFKLATVTKRILARIEANQNEPVKIYFHDVCDFNYVLDKNDRLIQLKLVNYLGYNETDNTENFVRYTYYLDVHKEKEQCMLKKEYFKHTDTKNAYKTVEEPIVFNEIPAIVFFNERDLFEKKGKSDIELLKDLQCQYNRRLSDFSDALRFQMFGGTSVIDGSEETVNNLVIAPNSLMAVETSSTAKDSGQQAKISRVESSFSNAEPVMNFLELLSNSMGDKLCIPRKESLKDIPSAKALKFLYNDLIARCDEKWKDWEPGIFKLIDLIVFSCSELNCYEEFDRSWLNIKYTKVLQKNFPIPNDEEDAKRLAIEEVNANVRSHRNYIKEYGNEEDYDEAFKEIIDDLQIINESEMDPISKTLAENNDINKS